MSYEEKGTWAFLVTTLGTYLGYVVAVVRRAGGGPLTEAPYVSTMLWALGIAIVAAIVLRIVVEMAVPSESYQIDVRDKDINRRGDYVTGLTLSVGMVLPLGLTLAELDHFWIANAIYAVYVVSTSIGAIVKIVAYRRGW
ncbi:hypothetical protein [Micromonospora sp. NBC_01813]|uniref:hypothetical protein n=1 Tax=Micromonospora sp. NBC_01813 TaxID=2975988 RepID=UPI002DD98969|nr:hypothetical protein [Micromonospora sp. NBC_01813]WSA09282.1 hypothetical protein OG958_00115 [Micromonospora sp. NBC_01813]